MFFLRKLAYKRIFKYKLKKVYLKKRLKKLLKFHFILKKKKIYKMRNINFDYKKTLYYNSYSFIYKFLKLNKKKKIIFFFNSFFFINIIKKKNNIFFNITDLKNNIIFSNSLKTLKFIKKKKDMLKRNNIYIFFLTCLRKFFKAFTLEKLFKKLPNIYMLSERNKDLLLKKIVRIFLSFIYFSINIIIVSGFNKYRKYLFSIRKTIKNLIYKKKIKILSLNLKYKNSFNGCRLRKLKRI